MTALKLIHLAAATILALGLAVFASRKVRISEEQLTGKYFRRMVWIPIGLFLLMFGTSGVLSARQAWQFRNLTTAKQGVPNILVIVMDTLRYDRFTQTGEKSLTPNLDRLVAEGVRYTDAWSTTSWSLPSQASILTGQYPHEHRADFPGLGLSDQSPTLANTFSAQGYVTGAFSGNSAWVTPEFLGRGFLRFLVYNPEDFFRRTAYGRIIDKLLWKVGYHSAGRGKKAPQINSEVLKFLDDYPSIPYFLYICYMDVNQAFHNRKLNYGFWEPKPPMEEVSKAYDDGLRELDIHIGELITALEKRNALDNTVIIITSDHGESFGEEVSFTNEYELNITGNESEPESTLIDVHDHEPQGHGSSLYPEQTRVPLFVVYPSKIPGGQTVDDTVNIRQIPATIAHLIGTDNSPFAGSPLPTVAHTPPPVDEQDALLTTLNYYDYKAQSVIWNHLLFLRDENKESEELYNLANDPYAQIQLALDNPLLLRMQELLAQLLESSSK